MAGQPLRIAFIGARGVAGTYSGIETYYEEVGSRLASRGHEVTVYCRSYFTPAVERYRGLRVRRLACVRSKHLETLTHTALSTADSLLRRYDVVQFHALGPALFSWIPRLVGSRTVASVRGLDWQRSKWGVVARRTLQLGEWASVTFPSATVVVSETLRRHFLDRYGRSTYCIPNAVAQPEHREPDRIREYGLEKDGFILFAGRLSPEKGVHTLLEALRPLSPKQRLVLAGGTSYSPGYVAELERRAWDEVLFLGSVNRTTMEELFSNCYAFVLPSDMEGLSVALLEAVSYGCCIITTAIPENEEIVGTTALTFPPGDVEALRDHLRTLLESPQTVDELRERARQRASSQLDWDEVARRTESLYQSLLGQGADG